MKNSRRTGTRIVGGALAVAALAGAPACAADQPASATNPTTTTAAQPPAETLSPPCSSRLFVFVADNGAQLKVDDVHH
ncbi:hypothetical protein [Amycolatopsis rifamycinica]|uniref:hypothetical protein n=1 Tax=Amycolatopsis rifamycinica TaxID=287986 RepID=UPI00126A243E|nr:hypothetical protein [Amycolatopsis rifamycinica]